MRTELPGKFIEKFTKLLGETEVAKLVAAINQPPKKAFRLNPLKPNYKEVRYPLEQPISLIKHAYYGQIFGKDIEHRAGYVYSQDPAAMFVAEVADVQKGERVLDLCAAPGGKSTQLGAELNKTGLLVANEINSSRAKILLENIERFGIANSVVLNETPARLATAFPSFFDKIVVDAPCSGEGMFRKDPDAIKYWSNEYVLQCASRQKEIVDEAYKMLRPGGRLIYSTCTFSPEEDEQIVEYLLDKYHDLELIPITNKREFDPGRAEFGKTNNPDLQFTARFWPQKNFGEGQFVSILQKSPKSTIDPSTNKNSILEFSTVEHTLTKEQRSSLSEFVATSIRKPQFRLENVFESNNHAFLPIVDPSFLRVQGLHTLRNGVELGEFKKKRFIPHHQLAQVLSNENTLSFELSNSEDYQRFTHGEAIKVDTDLRGYVLVCYQNKNFSWGKIGGDSLLKNFYPKGLRN